MTLDHGIRDLLVSRDLRGLFLDLLGWDQPGVAPMAIELDETAYSVQPVAQKRGLHVLEISTEPDVPSADVQHRLDAEIAQRVPERLLVFTGPTRQIWRWPHPRKSGGVRLAAHEVSGTNPPLAIVQRLAGVQFGYEEEDSLTLPAVKDRVRSQFNAEQVTNRFYERFQQQHTNLQDSLEGIEGDERRRWYASVLMNRLMFIYFLQKKGFLNDDRDYLRSCLNAVRQRHGDDEFYAFYRNLLLPMFHQGFGSHLHAYPDSEVAEILGDVPYVNGGIFEEHEIESTYEIRVPDEEFERIFDFFDDFQWHLDDRDHGDPNAINPDVIGYIFERYINLTTGGQKEGGAYYTKEDVTGYMAAATVLPRVLDRIVLATNINPFVQLQERPRRYLPEALTLGFDVATADWITLPTEVAELADDPKRWVELDELDRDDNLQLAGESWVETLDRRSHTTHLLESISSGCVNTVDELITRNLDIRNLVADVIHGLDAPSDIATVWKQITATTIIDPTCGSGAFLFAALDLLDELYAALLERARAHLNTGNADAVEHLAGLVDAADAHPNDAYYRRKHAALSNLYGLDIMPEAIETAKLRLFLALVSKLEARNEIEPLPDLDFNLRSGNLLVGFRDIDDARERVATTTLDAMSAVDGFLPLAGQVSSARRAFLDAQRAGDPGVAAARKHELVALLADVRDGADHAFAAAAGIDVESVEYSAWWLNHHPFHWLLEFPSIVEAGGFDVVVGNPPYINPSHVPYEYDGYKTGAVPEIYAPCVERSLGLLNSRGRLAMILPIAFQFGDRHRACRELVVDNRACWISTYSRNPSALFTAGLGVRSSIIVTSQASDQVFTTGQRRWQATARSTLFQTTRYSALNRKSVGDAWLPRTGDDEVAELLQRLRESGRSLGSSVRLRGPFEVGHKAFALYYLAAYLEVAPVFDVDLNPVEARAQRSLGFATEEDALLAFGLLAGDITLLWWMSIGDDFNVKTWMLKSLPIALDDIRTPEVLAAAAVLRDRAHDPENLLFTPYAKLINGAWDLRRVRVESRAFDAAALEALGLSHYLPAVARAAARFSKSTGERPGIERGLAWIEARRSAGRGG